MKMLILLSFYFLNGNSVLAEIFMSSEIESYKFVELKETPAFFSSVKNILENEWDSDVYAGNLGFIIDNYATTDLLITNDLDKDELLNLCMANITKINDTEMSLSEYESHPSSIKKGDIYISFKSARKRFMKINGSDGNRPIGYALYILYEIKIFDKNNNADQPTRCDIPAIATIFDSNGKIKLGFGSSRKLTTEERFWLYKKSVKPIGN